MKIPLICLAALAAAYPLFAESPAVPEDAPADHQGSQSVLVEGADGTVLLHAKDVSVHGSTVRYEPKPEKFTIGFWSKVEDWVSWQFDLDKPGKFEVEAMQGCSGGGSEVEIEAGTQKLTFTVEETGSFHTFIVRKLGTLTLPAGRNTLSVRPKSKKGGAVMDLRQILLRRRTE